MNTKRNEHPGGRSEAPIIVENGDSAAVETDGQDMTTKAKGSSPAAGRSPSPSPSLTPRGSTVATSLASALKRISTGDLLTELHATNRAPATGTDVPDQTEKPPVVNVVIVGAGLAGLAAAHSLRSANQGISILVLEASDRVGGRILTRELKSNTGRNFWDLGAQWISGSQIKMMQLIDQLDLQIYTQAETGAHLAHFGDGRKVQFEAQTHPLSSMTRYDYTTFITKVEKLRLDVSLETPEDCPMALEWDSMTLEQFRKRHIWTAAAQQYFDAQIRILFGVPPGEMSTLFFLYALSSAGGWHSMFEIGSETAREFRIRGGTQRLCEILADMVGRSYLRLGDPVISINQKDSDEQVTVQTLGGKRYRCERVVVALPPKFAAKINFSPPMAKERDNLLQRMPAGNSLCFVVTYKEAFWQKLGFSGYVIRVTSPAQKPQQGEAQTSENCDHQIPFSALFDATTMDQSPALSGKVDAEMWREIPVEERKTAILKGIEVFFGVEALQPLDYTEVDWGAESYSSSFPSSVMAPGAMTGYFQALRKPFQRVHWAGAETTNRWFGFMDGAVYSGKRAAHEVLNELRPDVVIGV
ncbi:probable flavin-containing monoamine oxidase A isoform X2 [Acanthaster planci]|uniref:Amine oxidase n=1 Tax=Acanthaster planci TaxID=133434 RepID=A0A8B7XY65_ACAPL|nr:probable flavin-containing monoamine oxidase A isoform X2 [Acanthaster planci]